MKSEKSSRKPRWFSVFQKASLYQSLTFLLLTIGYTSVFGSGALFEDIAIKTKVLLVLGGASIGGAIILGMFWMQARKSVQQIANEEEEQDE